MTTRDLSLGPESIQTLMREVLAVLEDWDTIPDDTAVCGCTMKEHDMKLNNVLKRNEQSGLKD